MIATPPLPSARKIWLGREREVGELEAGLDELLAGRGNLFLIMGEPGIGKTRLCDELGRSAAARGVAVHWGRTWEAGGAPSYGPFVQVLRSISRGLDAEALRDRVGMHGAELAELMPEIRQWIPLAAQVPVPVARERFQLFDAVNAFLHAASAKAPHVLVLDDLHAADPSSLRLLHFLVRDLRSRALMVIGTYREAEARLVLEIGRTLAQVAREAVVLPLRPLDRREVGEFVAQALGAAPSAEHVTALHRRTEGNPLFLRELLRLQTAAGRQPDGIREVVRARLALLTPLLRRALEAAAVLGRDFALEQLAALADMPELELSARLATAADAGIVEPLQQSTRWRFTHVLLREGLYEDLPADRRAALHRAAAAELQRCAGEPPLAELAHHLLHAIPAVGAGEAADAALRAAEHAMALLAFEDVCALLMRTDKVLEEVAGEERRRFAVLLGLGIARIRAGEVKSGKDSCLRAAGLARRLGDGELLARAVLGSACEFALGVRDLPLIALLEEALAALPAGDSALRARCMAQLAAERQPEPDTQPPIALGRAAIAMARRIGDVDTLRLTMATAGLAMLVFGDLTERLALDQEALRLALGAGDRLMAMRVHLFLALDHWERGDQTSAEAHLRAYEELTRELHYSRYRFVYLSTRACNALWRGQFAEAAQCAEQAQQLFREDESARDGAGLLAFALGLGRAAERYDDLPGVESQLRAAFGSLQQDLGSCVGEMLIAQLHGRAGDRQRAAAQLAAVRAHPLFADIKEASWLALLVDACHLLGEVALAQELYAALSPRAARFYNLGPIGNYYEPPYSRQLGLLAQTCGRLDDAVRHLADAEVSVVQAGMHSHLARLRYELAGVLLVRAEAGDRERAALLLDQARTLAEQLGQAGLLPLISVRAAEARPLDEALAHGNRPSEATFVLHREGDYWTIAWGSRTLRLRDSRGLQVLEHLVASPGQEFHVLQLVSPADGAGDSGDAGSVLDAEAVQRYRRRLLELREQLEEAEAFADAGRIERASNEIDALTLQLAAAVGLGGRTRRVGAPAERARTTVQKRLREAIRRIGDGLPELGTHLDHAIRTGTFCSYLPNGGVRGQHR